MAERRICSIPDCGNRLAARGWCITHYHRWRSSGSPHLFPQTAHLCSVDGCDSKVIARGWCGLHYRRWQSTGDAMQLKTAATGEPLAFLRETVANPPDECVEWPYAKSSGGYGKVLDPKRASKVYAHRLAWEMFHGRDMPKHMHAAHAPVVCHNRACVNPLHIREATPSENERDKVLDGVAGTVLTLDRVVAIRRELKSGGRTGKAIALAFGVSESTVSLIKHNKRWAGAGSLD